MGSIFFIRHGQASALSENYDQLSDLGIQQSKALAHYFSNQEISIDQIFSGPLERQLNTAKETMQSNGFATSELGIQDALKEHQCFKVVKEILPGLIEEDPVIRKLASKPFSNRNEQINNYLRIYEELSMRWVKNELEYPKNKFESWSDFKARSIALFENKLVSQKKINTLVFTSGGPISVIVGHVLGLSDQKVMELSWVVQNTSITEVLLNSRKVSLKSFNTVPHLKEKTLITVV